MRFERLTCGLPVFIKTVPNKVVTIDAWVNTGSANEDDANNGISHFLEHMLFKGTQKYGVGDLDKAIMNVGGVWNAGTSKDFTHYHVTVAAPFLATALDAISDMLQNSVIDAQEFDREKQVILEEYRRKQDNPYGVLYDTLYDTMFHSGPYKRTVLGSFESISSLQRDQMYDYYQRYYTPDNMLLLIVGDVIPDQVLSETETAFLSFRRSLNPLSPQRESTAFAPAAQNRISRDLNETYMAQAFPAPSIGDPHDVLALDLAATVLGDGRSSRLYQSLKEQKRLVNSVSAGSPTHKQESLFYVMSTLDVEKTDTVQAETMSIFRNFAESGVSDEEMAKARRVIRNGLYYAMETNSGQTGTIGYYYTIAGSFEFLDNYISRLNSMTKDDVRSVVAKYLLNDPVTVILTPNGDSRGEVEAQA